MKILFDNQVFKNQRFGGISRYYSELMSAIDHQQDHQLMMNRFFSNNVHLQEKGLTKFNSFFDLPHFRGKARLAKLLARFQDLYVARTIRKGKYDIFHPTYYDVDFLTNYPKKPFVLTVHDMIHELYLDSKLGKIHQETTNKRILIPQASHIIAVSHHTKKDILRCYPTLPEDKISVIYHGNSFTPRRSTTPTMSKQGYLLYVGLRNDYKNFTWLIVALKDYLLHHDVNLICAGGGNFTHEESQLFSQLTLQKHVSHQPIANDDALCSLYSNAFCLLFPSLYEGFGIPILEAFACDCPVIAIDASCFPEIAGNGALYFEANKQETLIQQLYFLKKQENRQAKVAEGRSQLTRFSWEKSVEKHLKIYQSILE